MTEIRSGHLRKKAIALKAFSCDYFLGSVNAMSEDGVFVNIDGNANRVAAYAYGPKARFTYCRHE